MLPPIDKFHIMAPILRNPMSQCSIAKPKTHKPKDLLKSRIPIPETNRKKEDTHHTKKASKHYRVLVASVLNTIMLNPTIRSFHFCRKLCAGGGGGPECTVVVSHRIRRFDHEICCSGGSYRRAQSRYRLDSVEGCESEATA